MRFEEATALFHEIEDNCSLKIPSRDAYIPSRSSYDSEVEGFSLCINTEIDNQALNCIKSIIEKRKLKHRWIIHRSQKVLEIYTPKKVHEN